VRLTVEDARAKLKTTRDLRTIRELRDQAKGVAAYHRARKDSASMALDLEAFVVEAECLLGAAAKEIAKQAKRDSGKATGRGRRKGSTDAAEPLLLADAGLTHKQSALFQRANRVPEELRERYFDAVRGRLDADAHARPKTSDVAALSSLGARLQDQIVSLIAEGKARDVPSALTALRKEDRIARLGSPVGIPDGQFRVICADPPWAYDNSGLEQSAQAHYDSVPAAEIASRWADDVGRVSTPESVLFCWATSPLLPEGLGVVAAWGFDYVASFVWVKDRAPGIGWWANTKHEILLVGRRDQTPHPARKLDTVIEAAVREHSRKPLEFYELIESMYPVSIERPVHLELFARLDRAGWVRGLYNQELVA
jgi:N6-adenosine-specific RNA methylase IME4